MSRKEIPKHVYVYRCLCGGRSKALFVHLSVDLVGLLVCFLRQGLRISL